MISASSFIPPTLIFVTFLPRLLAIDKAREVFPTPGGPTKQRIGLLILPVFFLTARYSIILSFTSSRPKWVLSRVSLTLSKSDISLVYLFQGRFNNQSR